MHRRPSSALGWMAICTLLHACQPNTSGDGSAATGRSGHDDVDGGAVPPGPGGGDGTSPERCNGVDDDRDGDVDETCACEPGQTQACFGGDPSHRGGEGCVDGTQTCTTDGEFASWGACEGWVDCDWPECTPENPFDEASVYPRCKDGEDNDCDGLVDCRDPECVVPGLTEEVCDDSFDDDCDGLVDCYDPDCSAAPNCFGGGDGGGGGGGGGGGDTPDDGCGGECIPGTERWCDTPIACAWGKQECAPDGRWGACLETTARPPGCGGFFYDRDCCVDAGGCCQNFPIDDTSVGMCTGIVPSC